MGEVNALLNKIDNAEFLLGDASTIFEELESRQQKCSLIVDPPRKGCDDDFSSKLSLSAQSGSYMFPASLPLRLGRRKTA